MVGAFSRAFSAVALSFALSGCVGSFPLMVSGFEPVQPAPTYAERFPVVESVKPTLVWSPFPGKEYPVQFSKPTTFIDERIGATNIRYDLIIWKPVNPEYVNYGTVVPAYPDPGRAWRSVDILSAVYERSELSGTSHSVEVALERGTEYAWSVRARFDVDGQTRVSEWSIVVIPFPGDEGGPAQQLSRLRARLTGELPPYALFYFVTP
jgi:hypothetical protein